MRAQKLDANKDPMDPLEQEAILGNHPYLLRSLSFSLKFSFIMETKLISHISCQVSLLPFVAGMSVVRMTVRISVVDDFEVPLTTLYNCVDIQENHIGSQGNTDTDTDTDTHRHTVRWVLLNNPSCLMQRLHIVILHPRVALALEWRGDKNIFFWRDFLLLIFSN